MSIPFSRESLVWIFSVVGAISAYVIADIAPDSTWAHYAKDVMFVIGLLCAWLRDSPLPSEYHLYLRRQAKK